VIKTLKGQLSQTEPAMQAKISKQIAVLEARIKSGDFGLPVSKPNPTYSKAIERALFRRNQLASEIRYRTEGLKPTTLWQKIKSPFQIARAVMTTGEMSYIRRQGGTYVVAHPMKAAAAFKASLQAFASTEAQHRIQAEIDGNEYAPLAARAKLHISPIEDFAKLSKMEEIFMTHVLGKIPILNNFQRAGLTFLNKMRMDNFELMAKSFTGGEPTIKQAQQIAMFINEMSGRGSLGSAERWAEGLNTVFFAPKFRMSRIQYLLGHSMWGGEAQANKIIAKEYARYLIGMGAMYTLASMAGYKVETDRTSADFGKIIIGKTRIDPLSGFSQVAVFYSRLVTGKKKNTQTGQTNDLVNPDYGKADVQDVISNYVRGSLSPMAGAAMDVMTRKDYMGNPTTPVTMTKYTYPITYGDIMQAFQNESIPNATAISLMGFFGEGIQTYTNSNKGSSTPKTPKTAKTPPTPKG
jgi:hypothetical protein